MKKYTFLAMVILFTTYTRTSTHAQGVLPPGVIIDQSPTGNPLKYVGSPSVIILPTGEYLASHDWFGDYSNGGEPDSALSINKQNTRIFRSTDCGASWSYITNVPYQHCATLFCQGNDVYLIGTSLHDPNGSAIIINKSTNKGTTWTTATTSSNGRLLTKSGTESFGCAPTPVPIVNGRFWRAFTVTTDPEAPKHTAAKIFFMSAATNADLLKASSWANSKAQAFAFSQTDWINARYPGWLEPNAVAFGTHKTGVAIVTRVDSYIQNGGSMELTGYSAGNPRYEVTARLVANGMTGIDFNAEWPNSWLHMPGSQSKFTVRWDALTGKYWALVSYIGNQHDDDYWATLPIHQRNTLMLVSSTNEMQSWDEHAKVLRWKEGEALANTLKVGFHYADWQFDDKDIIFVSRTSWNGRSYHDSNYLTFHRIKNFLWATNDSPDLGKLTMSFPSEGDLDGYVMGANIYTDLADDRALRIGDNRSTPIRSILSFYTGDLPNDALITGAHIKLWRGILKINDMDTDNTSITNLGRLMVDIKRGWFGASINLETDDFAWDNFVVTNIAEVICPEKKNYETYIALTDAGLDKINKAGRTQFRLGYEVATDNDGLWDYVSFYSGENTDPNKRPMLEVTYVLQTNFTSIGSHDGYMLSGGGVNNTSMDMRAGDHLTINRQYKTFLSFDTSELAGKTILSARLKLKCSGSYSDPFRNLTNCCYVDIKRGVFGSRAALEEEDFYAPASVTKVALLSDAKVSGGTALAEIDPASLSYINKSGLTQFRIYFPKVSNGDTTANYQTWYSGDVTDEADRPTLEITYR